MCDGSNRSIVYVQCMQYSGVIYARSVHEHQTEICKLMQHVLVRYLCARVSSKTELRESCLFMYCGLIDDAVSGLDYVLVVTNDADDDR